MFRVWSCAASRRICSRAWVCKTTTAARSSEVNPRESAQQATPAWLLNPRRTADPSTAGFPSSPGHPPSAAAPAHLGCAPWRGRAGGRPAAPPPPAGAAPSGRAAPWPRLRACRRARAAAPPRPRHGRRAEAAPRRAWRNTSCVKIFSGKGGLWSLYAFPPDRREKKSIRVADSG